MDRAKLPRPNTFAGLSLILDRTAERRDESAWITEQARSAAARYLLLDAAGEAFMQRDQEALRWLSASEREQLLGDTPASLLGIANQRPYFMLVLEDATRIDALEAALDARRVSLRAAGLQLSAEEAGLFAYAKGLSHWHPPATAPDARTHRTAAACIFRAPTLRSSCWSNTMTPACSAARPAGHLAAIPPWPVSSSRASRWKTQCAAKWPKKPASSWTKCAITLRSHGRCPPR